MCFTENGLFAWGKQRKNNPREESVRERSISPNARVVARAPNNRSTMVETPSLTEFPRPRTLRTAASMDSMNPARSNPTTPKSTDRGSRKSEGDSGVEMASPSSPVDEMQAFHTAVPALRVPNPRFTATPNSISGPASPAQWSLFPKEDTPRTANFSRPVTAGSQRTVPRLASIGAESTLSLKKLSPTAVEVKSSPSYARSEIASIHRNTRHFSYQSERSEVPPTPPPKPDSKYAVYADPDAPPLPHSKPELLTASYAKSPRPVSFRTFVAQSKGRSQAQSPSSSSGSTINLPLTPATPATGASTPIRLSRIPGPPPVPRTRTSRRTSLKSYLGRNGYSDEGIFVATSDDPEVPFTLFRWPNPNESNPNTPRSSTFVGR